MNQSERRLYLIKNLLSERPEYRWITVPADTQGQKDLLRSLMNVRMPAPISDEYIRIESEYLTEDTAEKGITRLTELTPVDGDLYLWQAILRRWNVTPSSTPRIPRCSAVSDHSTIARITAFTARRVCVCATSVTILWKSRVMRSRPFSRKSHRRSTCRRNTYSTQWVPSSAED